MADLHTLSMMDRSDDGTSASAVWAISAEERDQVAALLGRHADVDGLMTAEQAEQARRATRGWLTYVSDDSRM